MRLGEAMAEHLELPKAREKLRSGIGWVGVYFALCGVAAVVMWIVDLIQLVTAGKPMRLEEFQSLPPIGLALVGCAIGLWNVRSWSRLVVLVTVSELLAGQSARLACPGVPDEFVLVFVSVPVVYLVLPSTVRRFARAAAEHAQPGAAAPR